MSESKLDFVNEKFDSIDQTKIFNFVNENLKKNNKGKSVFYLDDSNQYNSDYRALQHMKSDPYHYKNPSTLISFFEKFIDHYSLLSVENIKSAIGQDKIDPKAKEYVDFELFWHDLNDITSEEKILWDCTLDVQKSIIERCEKDAGDFISDQMAKYWLRNSVRDIERQATIDLNTNKILKGKDADLISEFVGIISKHMKINKISFKDDAEKVHQKFRAATLFKEIKKSKISISIKKEVKGYGFNYAIPADLLYVDHHIKIISSLEVFFGNKPINKIDPPKLISYQDAKNTHLKNLINEISGKLLFNNPNKKS